LDFPVVWQSGIQVVQRQESIPFSPTDEIATPEWYDRMVNLGF
jgi:hypothetical protein